MMVVDRRLLIGKPYSNTLDALERSADFVCKSTVLMASNIVEHYISSVSVIMSLVDLLITKYRPHLEVQWF